MTEDLFNPATLAAEASAWLDGLRGASLRRVGSTRAEAASTARALVLLKTVIDAQTRVVADQRRAIRELHNRLVDLEGGQSAQSDADETNEVVENRDAINELHGRIEGLEVRVNSMPTIEYAGTWAADKTYRRGQFVTRQGSLWHAQSDTAEMPGTSENWRLAVKKGTFE